MVYSGVNFGKILKIKENSLIYNNDFFSLSVYAFATYSRRNITARNEKAMRIIVPVNIFAKAS